MNKAIQARRKKLEEWGAEDGFAELFLCINEGQANVNEEDQGVYDVDWAEEFRDLREKYNKGELDVSHYTHVVGKTPD